MLHIAICDDCRLSIRYLTEILRAYFGNTKQRFDITTYESGKACLEESVKNGIIDILFCDIALGEAEDGIALVRKLKQVHSDMYVVFISSYKMYYKAAFDVQPFHFLDKPIVDKEVFAVLDRIMERIYESPRLEFQYRRTLYRILPEDICYLEQDKRLVYLHCKQGVVYKTYAKLDDMEASIKMYSAAFFRIHKAFLVNFQYVKIIRYTRIELEEGMVLPVSYRYRKQLRQYCFGKEDKGITSV